MTREMHIDWQGPIQVGTGTLPRTEQALAALSHPAVYLFLRQYPGSIVAYVGKTSSFAKRLQEWYACFASGRGYVRTCTGDKYASGKRDDFFANLDNISELLKITEAEVKRTRFFYCLAPSEDLRLLESALIRRLKDRSLENNIAGEMMIEWGNSRHESPPHCPDPVQITMNYPPDASGLLKHVLGETPLTLVANAASVPDRFAIERG